VKYLRAHGPTNKFQAQWLEHPAPEGQPQRKDWLSDGGVGRKNWFQINAASAQPLSSARIRTLRPMRSANPTKTRQQHV
jgi:hypothetical protein